jgi:hypothetical protein
MAKEPKRSVRVRTYDTARWDAEAFPERMIDVLIWVSARLAEVPEVFRSSAELDLPADADDSFTVSYVRPETDVEHATRLAEISAHIAEKAAIDFPDDGGHA